MTAHFIVLLIVVPLMTAPVMAIINRGTINWVLAMIVSLVCLGMALVLLGQVLATGVISYHLGGWAPPIGIEYRLDAANAFVLVIICMIATVVTPYSFKSIQDEIPEHNRGLFYVLYTLCFTGLLGMTVTGDAFNVFVFMEISSLSTYGLVAMGAERDRRALKAAYHYLILGTIGATFFVIGVGLLYMMTGTLNMADLALKLQGQSDNNTVMAGIAFIVVGLALKAAMFPLHFWLPNAYAYAPSAVSAFQAATATKVAIYILVRFLFTIFHPEQVADIELLGWILGPMAVVAMFSGSLVAIFQPNLKRLLAFSSIAQIGYMMLGVSLATTAGLTAGLLHLFNHALMKGGLFLAVGCIVLRTGGATIGHVSGMGKLMPWTTAALAAGGLSLIGVPTTVGFISKWYLIVAVFEAGYWFYAVLIVASSLIAVVYVWKIIEAAYFGEPKENLTDVKEAPLIMLIPTWILILGCFYFGLNASLTGGIATRAAVALLGTGS